LFEFLAQKKLNILDSSAQRKRLDATKGHPGKRTGRLNYDEEGDDPYMRMIGDQGDGGGGRDAGESDSEHDEDFKPKDESDEDEDSGSEAAISDGEIEAMGGEGTAQTGKRRKATTPKKRKKASDNEEESDGGQKKKKRKKKDKNAPKKPMTAYMFWMQSERTKLVAERPELKGKVTEITKILGGKWKDVDQDAKDIFERKHQEDKQRYDKEMESYEPPEDAGSDAPSPKKKKGKKREGPKRPLSAYMFFSKENRSKIEKENPTADFGEKGRLVGAKWKSMTPEEREPYVQKNLADKLRYDDELTQWKNREQKSDDDEPPKKKDKPKQTKDATKPIKNTTGAKPATKPSTTKAAAKPATKPSSSKPTEKQDSPSKKSSATAEEP